MPTCLTGLSLIHISMFVVPISPPVFKIRTGTSSAGNVPKLATRASNSWLVFDSSSSPSGDSKDNIRRETQSSHRKDRLTVLFAVLVSVTPSGSQTDTNTVCVPPTLLVKFKFSVTALLEFMVTRTAFDVIKFPSIYTE